MESIEHIWTVQTNTVGNTIETGPFPSTGPIRFNLVLPRADFFSYSLVQLNSFSLQLLDIPDGRQMDLQVEIVNVTQGQNDPIGRWEIKGYSRTFPIAPLDTKQISWPQLAPVKLLVKVEVTEEPSNKQTGNTTGLPPIVPVKSEPAEIHDKTVGDVPPTQKAKATGQVELIDLTEEETDKVPQSNVSESPQRHNRQESAAIGSDSIQICSGLQLGSAEIRHSQLPLKKRKIAQSPADVIDNVSVESAAQMHKATGDTITIAIPNVETNKKPKVCSVEIQYESRQESNATGSDPFLFGGGNQPNRLRVALNILQLTEVFNPNPPDIQQQPITVQPPTAVVNETDADSTASATGDDILPQVDNDGNQDDQEDQIDPAAVGVNLPQFVIQVNQVDPGIQTNGDAIAPQANGRRLHPGWPANMFFLSDFSIVSADDYDFRVSKAILSNRSEYFRAILSHNDSLEIQNGFVVVPYNGDVLLEMLRFLYGNGHWPFTPNMSVVVAEELLKAAKSYDLVELQKRCEEVLAKQIDFNSLAHIIDLADKLSANLLMRKSFEKVKKLLKGMKNEGKVDLWLNLQPISLANGLLHAQLINFTNSKAKSARSVHFSFRGAANNAA